MSSNGSMNFSEAYNNIMKIISGLSEIISGKKEMLNLIVAAITAGGHVLIEGPPGSAKTLIVHGLSKVIGCKFKRVQGNPDLLPTDLSGYHVYSLDGSTRFVEGPIFTNILMFDELNRTPPRSQSTLLQAMAEHQASIDGVTYDLPKPFHVIATEIPAIEEVGVYPLTLTLRDRFWIKVDSKYVPPEEEYEVVKRADVLYDFGKVRFNEKISLKEFTALQGFLDKGVYVDERIVKYIVDVVTSIRNDDKVLQGPSHRGSIFLYRIAKAYALMNKRDYVIPDDIKYLAKPVLAHRIVLREEYQTEGVRPEEVVEDALNKVPVPKD